MGGARGRFGGPGFFSFMLKDRRDVVHWLVGVCRSLGSGCRVRNVGGLAVPGDHGRLLHALILHWLGVLSRPDLVGRVVR